MALDPDRVHRAFAGGVAAALGLAPIDAALGVQRIVDETMAAATRMHLAEKGRDPRDYTLVAFGGAGPVHAWNLARLLTIRRIIVPLGAGVASALGFLVAPPATDMVRSHVGRLGRLDWATVNALFAEMAEEGRQLLAAAGADPATIILKPTADLRHVGQGFEIPVPLPGIALGDADMPAIRASFFDSYRERFGRVVEDQPIEALSWRLACSAPGQDIRIGLGGAAASAGGKPLPRSERPVTFEGHGALGCPVYDRYALRPGMGFDGPALVEERESTCVVGPATRVTVDGHLNLVLELQ
jgi:N-methylhydantoinase A